MLRRGGRRSKITDGRPVCGRRPSRFETDSSPPPYLRGVERPRFTSENTPETLIATELRGPREDASDAMPAPLIYPWPEERSAVPGLGSQMKKFTPHAEISPFGREGAQRPGRTRKFNDEVKMES